MATYITDTAHLSGGYGTLGGSISFDVFGPGDTLCAAPLTTLSDVTVTGAGDYTSANFLTSATGIYRWKAHYSGDANNAAIDTDCNESGETSTVSPANLTITTTANPTSGTVGAAAITGDSATLLNANNPTGSVAFTLYSDPTCSTPVPGMSGSGPITSGSASWSTSWTPSAGGTYYWLASYPGDANNDAYTTTCGDANEQVTVSGLAHIGDFVWDDTNVNGIQDSGETGISGVTVDLMDSTGTSILQSTTTDSSGIYNFTVVPGSYIVQFVQPSGYSASPQYRGTDTTIDSNANISTGKSDVVTVAAGATDNTIDAGFFQPASLGDFVWNDLNANGVQDTGESGIPDVTVNLFNSTNTLIATTSTDTSGLYKFDNLAPDGYIVEFVRPAGYSFSPQYQGGDITKDSNANTTTSLTETITLVAAENNLTIDAGMFLPTPALGLTKTDNLNPATYNHVGQLVTFTLTATNIGNMTLHNVTVSDNPALDGYNCTPASPAASLAVAASIVCTGTHSITQADLDAGKYDDTASVTSTETDAKDASDTVVVSQTPDLSIFKTDGVTSFSAGGVSIYTVTVRNVGNMGVIGARVADAKPANILTWVWACTSQNGGASGCTPAASGASDFSDLVDLPAGGSVVYTVTANIVAIPTGSLVNTATVTLPEGFTEPTPDNNTSTDTDTLSADLNIVKTDGVSNYSAGGHLTYTVTVRNTGKLDVTGATVMDAKPANILNWDWACTSQNGGATDCTPATIGGADFSDTVNLPMGGSIVYTVFANIVANPSGDLINIATVTLPAGYSDSTPENNSSTDKDTPYVQPDSLPDTGFAPNRITKLPQQSISYADLGDLWLEIPSLGVKISIVGVPQSNGSWDVSWLGRQAGWLNGTAYPTSAGDSILTGHVYDAFGQPGPFVHINWLWYGDQIIVHAGDAQYVYEVREVLQVAPGAASSVIKHEELPWVTLITCRGYNEVTDSYKYRVAVRAVLVEVK